MSQPVAITPSPNLNISSLKASCSACSMHQLCLPMGLGESDMTRLDDIIGRRRKIPKDTHLYRIGDHFTNLYAIRLGHFKTFQVSPAGEQQVLIKGCTQRHNHSPTDSMRAKPCHIFIKVRPSAINSTFANQ